jgi:hypothetical protein
MIDSLTAAAGLPQPDPDQAHAVAHTEGRATWPGRPGGRSSPG